MVKHVQIRLTEQQAQLFHALAQEIAQGYRTKEAILQALSITDEMYEVIVQTQIFQRILKQAVTEWSAANNSAKRIRLKSQWAVEESIPSMFESMTDTNEPLSARVEMFKALSKVGHLDYHEATPGADRSFKIEINIGHGVAPITIDGRVSATINSESESESESESNKNDTPSNPLSDLPPADPKLNVKSEKGYTPDRFIPADPPTYSTER